MGLRGLHTKDGRRPRDSRKIRPGWSLFRDGVSCGEAIEQVAARRADGDRPGGRRRAATRRCSRMDIFCESSAHAGWVCRRMRPVYSRAGQRRASLGTRLRTRFARDRPLGSAVTPAILSPPPPPPDAPGYRKNIRQSVTVSACVIMLACTLREFFHARPPEESQNRHQQWRTASSEMPREIRDARFRRAGKSAMSAQRSRFRSSAPSTAATARERKTPPTARLPGNTEEGSDRLRGIQRRRPQPHARAKRPVCESREGQQHREIHAGQ